MQQFFSLLSWRLFTAQHVSGVFLPIIGSSMTAVAASGFTFVSWWQSCCVRGWAGSSTCYGHFPAHHRELNDCSGTLWFYLRIMLIAVLCSWSGWPARPRSQHDCHHNMKVKPEAATAVIELLMMGRKTPKTCWAVNKRQYNKLKNCCIRLVISLKCKTPVPKCKAKWIKMTGKDEWLQLTFTV